MIPKQFSIKKVKKFFLKLPIFIFAVFFMFFESAESVLANGATDSFSNTSKINNSSSSNYDVEGGQVKISLVDIGDGADGAVTISTNKNINTDTIATGRSYADGINYVVNAIGTNSVTMGRDIIKFTSTNVAAANAYIYWKTLSNGTTLATGDTIEYDVYLVNNLGGIGGIDIKFTDATYARDVAWTDQNSVSCHPASSIASYAYGTWFHRKCTVPSGLNGKIISYLDLVNEYNSATAITAYYDNFTVKNSVGTLKSTIYADGSPSFNVVDITSNAGNTGSAILSTCSAEGLATCSEVFGVSAGDEILLINLQGDATNNANVGNYEFLEVQSISGGTITTSSSISKIYGATTSNSVLTGQKIMVQRIPNYTDVTLNSGITLTASAWDGTKGGVVAFRANGTVNIAGTISVNSLGFRGGAGGVVGAANGGQNGESYDGYNGTGGPPGPTVGGGGYYGAGAAGGNRGGGGGGGAGGSTSGHNGGGGGAGGGYGGGGGGGGGGGDEGYAGGGGGTGGATGIAGGGGGGGGSGYGPGGAGGNAGNAGSTGTGGVAGGAAGSGATTGAGGYGGPSAAGGGGGGGGGLYGTSNLSTIFLGSGGAGGATGYTSGALNAGKNGGAGGGIVAIYGDTITITGAVSANATAGTATTNAGGASGGGTGGSILIKGGTTTLGTNLVQAAGGGGGSAASAMGGAGGAGGVGRIAVHYTVSSPTGSTNPSASVSSAPTYYTSSTITSINMLSGITDTVSAIDNFIYYLSLKPTGTTATVQFSLDASTWKNSAGTDGTDTLATGTNTISLSTLGWSGASFYYKIAFTGNNTNTPVLDDITINYTVGSSGTTCSPPLDGNFAITSNCSFANNVDGVDNGNLTVKNGATLTVNASQTLARNPGKSIIIETGGSIAINTTGQILQTYLWVKDVDGDYVYDSSSPQVAQGSQPSDHIRRYLAKTSSFGDARDGTITVVSNTNLNTWNHDGRTCANGGDAVNYSVTSLGPNTATLSSAPSSGCFTQGDKVLLINLQGTSSTSTNVGNYEILAVQSISGSTVYFSTNKTKYYGGGASDDTNIGTATTNQRVMLQRIPQYGNVTTSGTVAVTPSAWNGAKGGVLAFSATGTVTVAVNGSFNANGLGYRGGSSARLNGESFDGYQGSGQGGGCGGGSVTSSAGTACNRGGGGGSSGDSSNAQGGGGGGGYGGGAGGGGGAAGQPGFGAGNGGSGGNTDVVAGGGGGASCWLGDCTGGYGGSANQNGGPGLGSGGCTSGSGGPKATSAASTGQGGGMPSSTTSGGGGGGGGLYGTANLSKIFFGSGGGASNYNTTANVTSMTGGGIVLVTGNTINLSGTISSTGGNATNGNTNNCSTGGTGAGAGGSILLQGVSVNIGSSLVTALGGSNGWGGGGCSPYKNGGGGGGGGVGRIAVGAVSPTGTSNPSFTSVSAP